MKTNQNKNYGFWHMFVSIIGIVVGIGIFFKNDQIYALSGNNPLIALFAWILGAVLILLMAYSFIEIASVKLNKTDNGSITEWSKKFLGKKGGVIVSTYWHYIYIPLTYIVLATFSTDMIMSAIRTTNPGFLSDRPIGHFSFFFFIVLFLIILIPLTNTFFNKPSKIIQPLGTVIKFIPLLFVIVGSIVSMTVPLDGSSNDFDYNDYDSSVNAFILLIAAMPAILFSFDGFLAVSQLQKQGRKKNTYIKAMVAGLATISIVYIVIALVSFLVGDSNSGYSISAILSIITGGQVWIQVLLLVIIFISGTTGLNGFSTSGRWDYYSVSNDKLIYDKEEKFTKLSKNGLPVNSSLHVWVVTISWFFLIFGISFFVLLANPDYNTILVIDQLSNSYIVLAFLMYAAILIGGIVNRKTKKHKVKESKFFIPAAIVSSLFLVIINIYSFFTTLQTSFSDPTNLTGFFLIGIIVLWLFISLLNYLSIEREKNKISIIYNDWIKNLIPFKIEKISEYKGNKKIYNSTLSGTKGIYIEKRKIVIKK